MDMPPPEDFEGFFCLVDIIISINRKDDKTIIKYDRV
jgi:hypothetical protein